MMSMASGIGDLSKYQKITITPSSNLELSITHTLNVAPKIVIVSCDDTSEPYLSEGYIRHCVFDSQMGAYRYHNKTNHMVVIGGCTLSNSPTVSNGQYYISDSEIKIFQVTVNGQWSTSTTYTVDIYA